MTEDHGKSDQHHGKIMEISWNFVEEGMLHRFLYKFNGKFAIQLGMSRQKCCAGRSISVAVKHRHEFAVDDIRELPFIQLPEEVETELKFEQRTTNKHANQRAKVTNNNKDDGHSSESPSVNIDLTDDKNVSTVTDNVMDKDDNYVNQLTENNESLGDDRDNDYDNLEGDGDVNGRSDEHDTNDVNGEHYTDDFGDGKDNHFDFDDDDDNDDDDPGEQDDEEDYEIDDYYQTKDPNIYTNDVIYQESNDKRINDDSILKLHNQMTRDAKFDFIDKTGRKGKGVQTETSYGRDVTDEEAEINKLYELTERNRRAVENDWNKSRKPRKDRQEDLSGSDIWEDVTDEELEAVQRQQYIRLAKYIGWTLLSVSFFVLVGICFLRDPVTCIFSFGSGCPCFLIICPCVRGFVNKYLNVKTMVQDAMNKYTPGVIVNDDGTIQHYEPTAEEVAYLKDLLDEITGQTLI